MDKFGIFNILSTLFNGTGTEKSGNPSSLTPAKPLFAKGENAQAEERATFPPRQNSMLAMMKNHDEFVKRVHSKNGKNQIK